LTNLELAKPGNADSCLENCKHKLPDMFKKCLSVVCANSQDMRDRAFRLRFQVYCRERGFEDAGEHPDGREQDGYDARSLHSLLLDRHTGAAVGTVRLILPRVGDDLPVFRQIEAGERRRVALPLATTAEVSRFAVAKAFRRQLEEDWRPRPGRLRVASSGRGSALQLLTFGLIQAIVMMTALGGITHIVAMMEPALLRLLRRLGIEFHPLGELVDHHGLRQPGWALMVHLIARIKACHPELAEIIADAGRLVLEEPSVAHA
jgi:N-acyl amino acid synthase of PEP-CTERM/exosortase system